MDHQQIAPFPPDNDEVIVSPDDDIVDEADINNIQKTDIFSTYVYDGSQSWKKSPRRLIKAHRKKESKLVKSPKPEPPEPMNGQYDEMMRVERERYQPHTKDSGIEQPSWIANYRQRIRRRYGMNKDSTDNVAQENEQRETNAKMDGIRNEMKEENEREEKHKTNMNQLQNTKRQTSSNAQRTKLDQMESCDRKIGDMKKEAINDFRRQLKKLTENKKGRGVCRRYSDKATMTDSSGIEGSAEMTDISKKQRLKRYKDEKKFKRKHTNSKKSKKDKRKKKSSTSSSSSSSDSEKERQTKRDKKRKQKEKKRKSKRRPHSSPSEEGWKSIDDSDKSKYKTKHPKSKRQGKSLKAKPNKHLRKRRPIVRFTEHSVDSSEELRQAMREKEAIKMIEENEINRPLMSCAQETMLLGQMEKNGNGCGTKMLMVMLLLLIGMTLMIWWRRNFCTEYCNEE